MTRTLLTAIFLTLFSQTAWANLSDLIKCSQLMPSEELQNGWKCSDGSIYESIASLKPVAQCFKNVADEGSVFDSLPIGQLAELGKKRLNELCDKNPEATFRDMVRPNSTAEAVPQTVNDQTKQTSIPKINIEGAFGIKLGQKFEGENVAATFNDGEKALKFNPVNPHPMLKSYGVMVTPVSKTVYKLMAFTSGGDESDQCDRNRKVVEVLLDKKYGEIKIEKDYFKDHIDYVSGEREINLYCNYSGQLILTYRDQELEDLGIKETASTQDGSGF
jgi:hypothetical protein